MVFWSAATSSFDQVKWPIYNRSLGRWENYNQYLGEIEQILTLLWFSDIKASTDISFLEITNWDAHSHYVSILFYSNKLFYFLLKKGKIFLCIIKY